ncbi:MAG TPA: hypothetical protein VMV79_02180 [Alphaproteobacteria bacterium]|nr:hypothetical protein [Alphaproteobacteria bacterium]
MAFLAAFSRALAGGISGLKMVGKSSIASANGQGQNPKKFYLYHILKLLLAILPCPRHYGALMIPCATMDESQLPKSAMPDRKLSAAGQALQWADFIVGFTMKTSMGADLPLSLLWEIGGMQIVETARNTRTRADVTMRNASQQITFAFRSARRMRHAGVVAAGLGVIAIGGGTTLYFLTAQQGQSVQTAALNRPLHVRPMIPVAAHQAIPKKTKIGAYPFRNPKPVSKVILPHPLTKI